MPFHDDEIAKKASSRTYSKIGRLIEERYRVPFSRRYGGHLCEDLMTQIETTVRDEARGAAIEGAHQAFVLASAHLPEFAGQGLFVPSPRLHIAFGDVGEVRLQSFNSERTGVFSFDALAGT